MKVEEPSADDQGSDDDDISDPDEDTLAGQMAAMRGGSVKKIRSEDSDDKVARMMIKRVVLTVIATVINCFSCFFFLVLVLYPLL